MYGISRTLAVAVPIGAGVLAVLHGLGATRFIAIATLSVLVAATALAAAILEDRHSGLDAR
jgi:hypothetical protein